METIEIKGKLMALSPIHHGGDEKTGVSALLRRIDMITASGKIEEIPYIDGNAVRGNLRRMVFSDFLERLGYKLKSVRLYHAFFSGGLLEVIDKKDIGFLSLKMRRKIRDFLIPVSVLGMSYGNQAFEGKLKVGKLLPFCKELQHIIDNPLIENSKIELLSYHRYLSEVFITRRDDLKSNRKDDDQAIQMKVNKEVFIPGTIFDHYFIAYDQTEIEKAFTHHMINLWKSRPFIGGGSGSGDGKLKLEYDTKDLPNLKIYFNFLEQNKDKIIEIIKEFDYDGSKKADKKKSKKKNKTKSKSE